MKQKWWILLTLLLCGCGASSQPDQTGAVQNDRPRLSASMEETAENVEAVEKNKNLEKTLKFKPESGRRAELDSVCDGYCDAV